MATAASDLFGSKKRLEDVPISVIPRSNETSNEDDMAVRRHEPDTEDFSNRELLNNLLLAQTSCFRTLEMQAMQPKAENGNGSTNRRVTWLMAIFAMVTLFGTGANFLASSGMWIGNRNRDADEIKNVKDELANLKTWNEKLRNNMAAYGWLIDNEGNVSRIEEANKAKRR
jgi:hypothetical protein